MRIYGLYLVRFYCFVWFWVTLGRIGCHSLGAGGTQQSSYREGQLQLDRRIVKREWGLAWIHFISLGPAWSPLASFGLAGTSELSDFVNFFQLHFGRFPTACKIEMNNIKQIFHLNRFATDSNYASPIAERGARFADRGCRYHFLLALVSPPFSLLSSSNFLFMAAFRARQSCLRCPGLPQ